MGSPEPVVVLAHWQASESTVDTVIELVKSVRQLSLGEPGCLGYEIFQGIEDRTALTLIERYRDTEALNDHLNSSHYQELVAGRIRPLLSDRRVEFLLPRPEPATGS